MVLFCLIYLSTTTLNDLIDVAKKKEESALIVASFEVLKVSFFVFDGACFVIYGIPLFSVLVRLICLREEGWDEDGEKTYPDDNSKHVIKKIF